MSGLSLTNTLLLSIIIYLFFILYNKKNCNVEEITLKSAPNDFQVNKKKSEPKLPDELLRLIRLAIEELNNSKILEKENPASAIIICKKILENTSIYPTLLINSLKTILEENTLSSRYLLEIRFYLSKD